MKVAMIGHKRIPSREGGVEIVVEELAKRMVEEGHQVDVYNRKGHHVSGEQYDQERLLKEYEGIKIKTIFTFQNGKLNAVVYSFLATMRALFGGYDVIHFHAEGPCSMLWIPKLFGIRTVATIHGLDWKRSKWGGFATRFLKFGEKIAARYADEVIVLSKNLQEYFQETYGREVTYIPNGTKDPEVRNAKIIKENYGLDQNQYILFLARIVPEKGLHYLIEAFKNIETDLSLVVVGGSSHTDDYYKQIEEAVSEDARIKMVGFVQGEELNELYSNAYLYVLPSDIEGMPLSLLEAMSYGNCCLVSDIPENKEVVRDHGVTFKQGDVSDLQLQLERLLQNQDEVDRKKAVASDYICKKYSWSNVTEQTLLLYGDGWNAVPKHQVEEFTERG